METLSIAVGIHPPGVILAGLDFANCFLFGEPYLSLSVIVAEDLPLRPGSSCRRQNRTRLSRFQKEGLQLKLRKQI